MMFNNLWTDACLFPFIFLDGGTCMIASVYFSRGQSVLFRPVPSCSPSIGTDEKGLKINGRPIVPKDRCFFSRARAQAREFTPIYMGRNRTTGRLRCGDG